MKHSSELREEIVDEVREYEHDFATFKVFKPFVAAWQKLNKFCQPVMEFHDKYIMYVLWATLLGGTALVVLSVYMRR